MHGLEIGLVNNMPDSALESTERQFVDLLAAAANEIVIRLTRYSLPQVPRSEAGRDYVRHAYRPIDALFADPPDALIVTGTEPRAQSLREEPYWASLAALIDWTKDNAVAAVWSCLAAHAAVLHRDGVERLALAEKCFGLFECRRACDHPLTQGLPSRVRVAHSRWNELSPDALTARGYTILTRSPEAGVDAFVKSGRSLALFFQGHPEYDARALLREYRRDIGRFLRGARATYPELPRGYFGMAAVAVLNDFRARALANPREALLDEFPLGAAEAGLTPNRDSPAARIYGNWLAYLLQDKARRTRSAASRPLRPAATSFTADGVR
jgi:homoserine O-succinyltransferase